VVNGSDGRLPRRKLGFEKRQVGSIRQRIADLAWLLSRSFGTTYADDIMAVNLKNLDFSPLSEFLVSTGATRPRITEHLSLFERKHLISRDNCQLVVNRDRLESFLAQTHIPAIGAGTVV
jgi:hypothetical protein